MNIIFNTDQVYLHGGIEKVMATKANYFASLAGFKVTILTTEQQNKLACYPFDSRVEFVDLGVNYNRRKSYFSPENFKKALKHFFRHRKILKELQPDIIISPNFNFDHYWLPFIKPSNTKVIKELHASGYNTPFLRENANFLSKIKWQLNDSIMAKYDCIVVLNDDEKKYQLTNNVKVIPNPIEISDKKATLENKQVIAAGRISPVKGFDQLIASWKIVHELQPEWQLHIFGETYGDTKQKLQDLIQDLELDKVVIFQNSVENLPQTMLDYSIYAMSSITECFPMVLLEAQSVGLPLVSYDCPNGPRHIINNHIDGLLVQNQNPSALANALLHLIEDEKLRKITGSNAKKNSANFATPKIMQQWLHLLQDLNKKQA